MCAKFVMVDIKLYFTCGELDLYWSIVKFQTIMSKIVAWHNNTIKWFFNSRTLLNGDWTY